MSSAQIVVEPSGGALGADVAGVDLARLDDSGFATILAAWHRHLVLRIRGQTLDDHDLMRFSARFGELDLAPITVTGERFLPKTPEVQVMSNVQVGGRPIGSLGNYEAEWHTDMSYNDLPPLASCLYSLEVPEVGGDTWFANMYLAYETLPVPLRARLRSLRCKHDASRNSVGLVRKGFQEHYDDPRDVPGAIHPLVRRHPATGRNVLFLGRRRLAFVDGLAVAESDALLDALWAHAVKPEFVWVHRWRVGDVILWDNRCTLHRRDGFAPEARRILHRTQIRDSHPVIAGTA
ncbi:MAG: TauD/TfdA family dioxygenase [Alphaproteobacteria bacterium]|nr:TauD/TfdA family dioxygenase [Alphaproteobacteria bacterium]